MLNMRQATIAKLGVDHANGVLYGVVVAPPGVLPEPGSTVEGESLAAIRDGVVLGGGSYEEVMEFAYRLARTAAETWPAERAAELRLLALRASMP